jgi:DNA polymerase/3'-5' exonuclease PolX
MNKELLVVLEELRKIADIQGEVYKEKAYRKAILGIKNINYVITGQRLPDLKENKIPGIGQGILSKIVEFIKTGKIKELDKLRTDKRVKAYNIFSNIIGVGPATIEDWLSMKVYNLTDLRKAISSGKISLNHMQKLGLKYYSDLTERIPRAEVTSIGESVRRILDSIKPGIKFEISGSYRRGAATSGDIDIILTHDKYDNTLLTAFRNGVAHNEDYIDTTSSGEQRLTFLWRSRVSGKIRQVDLVWIPPHQFAPSILYFTGSWEFNEKMRGIAKAKGYRLNQMGLFKIKPDGTLELIHAKTEKDIFDILGMKYLRPEERNL